MVAIYKTVTDEIRNVFDTLKVLKAKEIEDTVRPLNWGAPYFEMKIVKDVKTEEPSAECPFKPTATIEKEFVELHKNVNMSPTEIFIHFTTPMLYILGMTHSRNFEPGS